MMLDEHKIKLLARALIFFIITSIIISVFINFKLNLYFSDRYSWYVFIGYKYYSLIDISQGNKALEYADKALNLDPSRPDAHKLRADFYYWLSFYNRSEEALSELNNELFILKNMNESSFYYKTMGRALREQDKLNESLYHLKKAVEEGPDSVENNIELGLVYLKVGDAENALIHLSQSRFLAESQQIPKMRKDYILVAIHISSGFFYLKQGLDQKAEEEFKTAKSTNSIYFESIYELVSS